MVLKQEIVDAFAVLGLTPDVEQSVASTAYKKLALRHHPDRNLGDSSAHERFQKIGEAWSVCQRHYDHPAFSHVPEPGAQNNYFTGRTYSGDEDVPLDPYEEAEFFKFMFKEMFFGRFTHSKGQRYRQQRAGFEGDGVHAYSGGFAEAQVAQNENRRRQRREHEEYIERVRQFEAEIAAEQAEADRRALKEEKKAQLLISLHSNMFRLARDGKGADMRRIVQQNDLDVTKSQTSKKDSKAGKAAENFETLLHVSAASCDEETVLYLLRRGADPSALNKALLTPFHVAILKGNIPVVRCFLSLVRTTKASDPMYQALSTGCHPSKATKGKEGRTPLQLAIESGKAELVELMLKDATVHDVEKCWLKVAREGQARHGSILQDVCNVLSSKKGFSPPEDPAQLSGTAALSKKALRKRCRKEEEERAKAAKAQRIAEQEENARKKLEKRAEVEARQRRKREEEAEEEARMEEERIRREEEERIRQEEEERIRQEEENRLQIEKARILAEETARREAEEIARRELAAAEEEKRRKAAIEAKEKQEAAKARRAQREADRARAKTEQEALERAEAEAAEKERLRVEELARQEAEKALQDATMRKRAEQSARDKARYQQKREESARLETARTVITTPTSPTQSSTRLRSNPRQTGETNAESSPLIYDPSSPPPVPKHTRPKPTPPKRSYQPIPAPLSPPMTPEFMQTREIPDDLFAYEPPPRRIPKPSSPLPDMAPNTKRWQNLGKGSGSEPVLVSSTDPSTHTGNGVPCRFFRNGGCKRGNQCTFSHAIGNRNKRGSASTTMALEKQLARKELEIQQLRAELGVVAQQS